MSAAINPARIRFSEAPFSPDAMLSITQKVDTVRLFWRQGVEVAKDTDRDRDAARKREKRAKEHDLAIPECLNPKRREAAEKNTRAWLKTYCPRYYGENTGPQIESLIDDIDACVLYGGDQATAASRGIGKSTLILWSTASHQLRGNLSCAVIIAQNGDKATKNMVNLKNIYTTTQELVEDYPEVIVPILDVMTAPQRGMSQTANGVLTKVAWTSDMIVLPTVAGSRSSGFACASLSIDSGSIRGFNWKDLRPQLVILDDPETRESAKSETETENRRQTIEADIADMGTPERPVSRIMLTTIQNRRCVSWEYTDRKQKPSFMGRRFKWMESWPTGSIENVDGRLSLVNDSHWGRYVAMRREDMQNEDRYARRAHQYFLDNYNPMMDGAKVTSERHDSRRTPDGSKAEVNSVQRIFNVIADRGDDAMRYVMTEWQNEPPPDNDVLSEDSGITDETASEKLNGLPRETCEELSEFIGCHIDVHNEHLTFVVMAMAPDGSASVIDYGDRPTGYVPPNRRVDGGVYKSEDESIKDALTQLVGELDGAGYSDTLGRHRPINRGLVDVGYKDSVVWSVISNNSNWSGAKGLGDGKYHHPAGKSITKRVIGEHIHESRQSNRQWQVNMDTDYWIRKVHEMFLADTRTDVGSRSPGSLAVWGADPGEHVRNDYPRQIASWKWTTKFVQGKGHRTKLWPVHKDDHYLDATYGALVACEMLRHRKTSRRAASSGRMSADQWFAEPSR